jgi:hypothetical protein
MEIQHHGLSVGIDRVQDQFFITMRVVGKLTHQDYTKIIPMIDGALSAVDDPKANVLLDATEFEGWELRAAWDDLKLGLKHGSDFSKIAIVGDKRWLEIAAKVGGWFISGEVRYFEQFPEALSWLNE